VTVVSAPAPADHARPRPLPWRRMAGVTWRQHRIALAGVVVLLGALAVVLWITGSPLHQAWAAAAGCHPASSAGCQALIGNFDARSTGNAKTENILLQVVPALIGAFAGAPVLARELEAGTFRFAWTQGFARWRWALAKLVALPVVLAALTAAFGVLVSWYCQPYAGTGAQFAGLNENTPFANLFSLREVTFPAWTVAAFAIAALAGMLIRRTVPAIVATLAVYAGLAFTAAAFLREHYLTPLVTTNLELPGTTTAWVISQWFTKGGRYAFGGNPPLNILNQYCSGGKAIGPSFAPCLAPHGYTQWTSYQPASRFWPFQWIECGWLLGLSVLLIAAAIWLVHRRAA